MKFLNKWGVKEGGLSELSKLKNPNDSNFQQRINSGVQWTNRAASVAGGSLVFVGQSDTSNPNSQLYTQVGGVLAIISPFIETLTSYLGDQVYGARQEAWDGFEYDLDELLNNYHELLGILETLPIGEKGEVNEALKRLDCVANNLLDKYDEDGNKMIDTNELVEKREDLAKDLDDKEANQFQIIIKSIEDLKTQVVNYNHYLRGEELRKRTDKRNKYSDNNIKIMVDSLKVVEEENLELTSLVEYSSNET